ncbi:MAG: DNA-3-methyladenine glycosylase II [Cytophagales bacterium]|jgi:DNA-3-methyladenine glycosylase|nr:DNA-3-methyladenine glycosylase [Bacteroidota bacterium]MBS1980148.1 DNA-3-methyladenine glycosylase [Bacteroidota bacterium]WHZ08659.1 MAG: DNA-3-methyladenine glycosylase II [Cytophagales bacterium]
MKLELSFYQKSKVTRIAQQLLGKLLFSKINNCLTSGMIVETEAYSEIEKGSHAHRGKTRRNEVMFGEGGVAYVYLCYGVHEMFNVVTNVANKADAILIRALQPMAGADLMMKRMKVDSMKRITSGPGKLTKAMGIGRKLNGISLRSDEIWIEDCGVNIKPKEIVTTPRIGIDYAGKDAQLPWRYFIKENVWVSKLK